MATVSGRSGPGGAPANNVLAERRSRDAAIFRLFLGGLAGTAAITLMMYFVDPLITGRTMDIAQVLGRAIGSPRGAGGMVFHVFNGVILFPLGFAFLSVRLPGPAIVKGLIWGVVLWALAESLIMPMLGSGFFGDTAGGLRAALSSLAGHLVYGGLQGVIAGSRGDR
jgi:hypothetical protein